MGAGKEHLQIERLMALIISDPVLGGPAGIGVQVIFRVQGAGRFLPRLDFSFHIGGDVPRQIIPVLIQDTLFGQVIRVIGIVSERSDGSGEFMDEVKSPILQ
jgi:hypothetical protein